MLRKRRVPPLLQYLQHGISAGDSIFDRILLDAGLAGCLHCLAVPFTTAPAEKIGFGTE
jgi:hypothetical protein